MANHDAAATLSQFRTHAFVFHAIGGHASRRKHQAHDAGDDVTYNNASQNGVRRTKPVVACFTGENDDEHDKRQAQILERSEVGCGVAAAEGVQRRR